MSGKVNKKRFGLTDHPSGLDVPSELVYILSNSRSIDDKSASILGDDVWKANQFLLGSMSRCTVFSWL